MKGQKPGWWHDEEVLAMRFADVSACYVDVERKVAEDETIDTARRRAYLQLWKAKEAICRLIDQKQAGDGCEKWRLLGTMILLLHLACYVQ